MSILKKSYAVLVLMLTASFALAIKEENKPEIKDSNLWQAFGKSDHEVMSLLGKNNKYNWCLYALFTNAFVDKREELVSYLMDNYKTLHRGFLNNAIAWNHDQLIKRLIRGGAAGLNDLDGRVLRNATYYDQLSVVQMLLEAMPQEHHLKYIESESGTMRNNRALEIAAEYNRVEIARLLIKMGSNIDLKDRFGGTVLMKAAERGSLETVQLLLEAKADVSIVDNYGRNALILAAKEGHLEVVQLLLNTHPEIDVNFAKEHTFRDHKGNIAKARYETALIAAASHGHARVVRELVGRGARIEIEAGLLGKTAMGYALLDNRSGVIAELLIAGAEKFYQTPYGHFEQFSSLTVADRYGNLSLIQAVRKKSLVTVQRLLAANGDVNEKIRDFDVTALMIAAEGGDLDMVKELLTHKPDVNAETTEGMTALKYAARAGKLDVVNVLLDAQANIDFIGSDRERKSAETLARIFKCPNDIDKYTLRNRERKELNKSQKTALMHAAQAGHLHIVELLLRRGADANMKDSSKYWTALGLTLLDSQKTFKHNSDKEKMVQALLTKVDIRNENQWVKNHPKVIAARSLEVKHDKTCE